VKKVKQDMSFKNKLVIVLALVTTVHGNLRVENFNGDRRFAKGAQPGAQTQMFDDKSWECVRVPHDWAIVGPFTPKGNGSTRWLPWEEEGWCRKTFTVDGPAVLQGVGNGDPRGLDSFTDKTYPLYYGKAVAVLRPLEKAGILTLTAQARGVKPATVTFASEETRK
jgi:hypothetical protein